MRMASDISTTSQSICSQIITWVYGWNKDILRIQFLTKFLLCTLSQVVFHQNKRINQAKDRHGIYEIRDLTWERSNGNTGMTELEIPGWQLCTRHKGNQSSGWTNRTAGFRRDRQENDTGRIPIHLKVLRGNLDGWWNIQGWITDKYRES